MTSKPNVIVVQKTTGKGTTIQGLPGKNVVTTLLNAGVSNHFKSQMKSQVASIHSAKGLIKSKLCMSSLTDPVCLNVRDV